MARLITIEDLYQIQFVSRPRISPDGQRVAYVVTRIDDKKHEYRSALWIAAVDGSETRQFTAETTRTNSPAWSPDGKWLAFVREGEEPKTSPDDKKTKKQFGVGKPQIWLIPTNGGEARQLTFVEHGASSPVWSPNNRQLLFSALVGPSEEETEEGKPLPKVRVIDRLWYRLDGVGFIYDRRSHLFLIDIDGGEPQQLTEGDWDDGDAVWSPDGSQIAFVSNHADDRWHLPGADVYIMPLQNGAAGELRCLTDGQLAAGSPSWSLDGKTIAFLAAPKLHSAGHVFLYTIGADANKAPATCLTQEFEGICADWTNSDLGDEHLMPAPAWSADGKTLYVLASQRGSSRIYTVPAEGTGPEPATLTPGETHVRDASIDAAHQTLALLVGSATRPQEIFIRSTNASEAPRQLTHVNDEFFQELQLAEPEYLPYTGEGGWPIDGWILKPHNFDPTSKYPLVVEIHGGPHTQYGYGFFHEMQLLVAQGYVVFYTNPRGSCGYGYDFANAVRGAWGEKDSLDIQLGIDALIQRGYIDEQRIGVTGGSYGGFMTNWLIGHSDRFRVAITDRCVTNMASMFGSSDIGWDLAEDNLETTPWERLDRYMHMSPISYVQHMHTPLLIIHSEQDLRCNIEQAEQLFAALKWMGREVQFVRFEGQSHGLSRGGHPHSRLERLRHITTWFERYLA
jgi:dipeptidyl aminopeptidase/acylaminoacyl peptidase